MAVMSMETQIDQIELKADPLTGQIAFVILQNVSLYLVDGVVVSRQIDRNSMAATDPAADAVMGEALTSSMVTIQNLQATILTLQGQLVSAQAALAAKP